MQTSWRRFSSSSSRGLDQDEYVRLSLTSSKDVCKTSARRLGQDQYIRLGHTFSRRLQDIFKTSCQDVLQRSLQDVFKTYHQVKLRSIQYVSERFFSKEVYLQRYLPMWHCFWEIYGQCTKFAREVKISRVLVFLFTTPFSRCLQKHF